MTNNRLPPTVPTLRLRLTGSRSVSKAATLPTHMLENGADIRFVQQLLGHAKLEATTIYTEVSIEQLKAVHAKTHPTGSTNRKI